MHVWFDWKDWLLWIFLVFGSWVVLVGALVYVAEWLEHRPLAKPRTDRRLRHVH